MAKKTAEYLARNLAHLMEITGWSAKEVSKRSGVSPRMVSYMLTMERVASIEIAEDVARAFNLEGWHMIMPNLPADLEQSKALRKLVDDYIESSDDGKEMIARIAEREAKYGA